MKKNLFKILLTLTKDQPWLEDRADELEKLLYTDCGSDEERELIIELLARFTHVSNQEFSRLINKLVDDIVQDPTLSDSNTQIVAMTGDYCSDSAQFVTYALKAPLEKRKWRKHRTVTNFQRSYKEYKDHGFTHTNIILVDEFVGSGKTVIGRVKQLKRVFQDNKVENISIKVKVLAASSIGIQNIKDSELDIDLVSFLTIEQGISEHYSPEKVTENLSLMSRLESILSNSFEDRQLPNLGYGGTESLYTRDDGNTPNSVFPIFWWPFFANGTDRDTLLIRAMGDA